MVCIACSAMISQYLCSSYGNWNRPVLSSIVKYEDIAMFVCLYSVMIYIAAFLLITGLTRGMAMRLIISESTSFY